MKSMFDLGATGLDGLSDAERAQRVLDDAMADHGLSVALDRALAVGGREGLRLLGRFRGRIAATESQILAERVGDDGDTRAAERMLADGKTSKREQRKKAKRAKAVSKNPDLAAKLADRDLSEEQLDVIADASAKTDGAAACDDELIDKVAAVPPEQGKTFADDYVADHATPGGVKTEHDRQRKQRRGFTFHNQPKGLQTITVEGDGVASKEMWDAIERRAKAIFKRDGGSDVKVGERPRTRDQRRFDAAFELITGQTVTPDGRTTPDNAKAGKGSSKRHTAPRPSRPRIVIGLTVDQFLGRDPAAIATQIGLGLIPDSVIANYVGDADIFAALFNQAGEPLWLARLERYATSTQMIALILRDRHCVLCGADHTGCDAHHTMPWNAPGKGRSDLDDLVLLCGPCHTQLHAEVRTIYQDKLGVWRTRPSTPDEIPVPRPTTTRNQIRTE